MSAPRTAVHQPWPGLIEAYRDRLPVGDDWTAVTLLEGGTPLIAATRLSEKTGCRVHLKVEGLNPTGSFKDRGMTMAVTDAVARGQHTVLCASTGNTSASAAAYAARAGITCAVLIPQGKIAMGKLAQAVMHGAKIIQIDGNFDDCLELARKMAADFPTIALVNSVNPVRIEGQKTAAFEIVDALGTAPDVHALPVGNAGNITAYWKGYTEYHHEGLIEKLPRMLGTQAAGAAPLVNGKPVKNPETIRDRDPHRRAGLVDGGRRRAAAIQRPLPGGHRRGDPGRLPPGGRVRRCLRRTRLGGQHRRSAQGRRRRLGVPWVDGRVHGDRQRPQGSRYGVAGNAHRGCAAGGSGSGGRKTGAGLVAIASAAEPGAAGRLVLGCVAIASAAEPGAAGRLMLGCVAIASAAEGCW